MREVKDIILERRINNLEIDGKQVPNKYINVFNTYLEQMAESLSDYTKQVKKEVVQELKNKMLYCSERFADGCHYYNGKELDEIIDQI